MFDVVGLGACSVDYVYVVPAPPAPDGPRAKLRIASHFVSCGGQVATMVAACAAFGLRARYLGPFGSDANAGLVRDELARRKVVLDGAIAREGTNQFAVILVDERTGERMVLWDRDPRLSAPELDADAICSGRVLHVDDVDEDLSIRAARIAAARGVIVTTDLDRVTERTAELVAAATLPIFDEHVPAALTGESDPERALRKLRRAHTGLLVMTLGARGAMALDGDRLVHEPAVPVTPVDTTSAGDIFRAGFLTAFLGGRPLAEALREGNRVAAKSCTVRGAMASIP